MTKILGKLKPYTFQIILVAVLTLAGVYADLFLPEIMSRIINQGVAGADKQFILVQGLKMLLFALLAVVCGVSSGYFSARVSMFYGRDLRAMLFRQVSSFSLAEYDHFGPASLITRTTNDITLLQNSLIMTFRILVRAPLMIIGGVTMAWSKSPELSRNVLFSIPVQVVLVVVIASVTLPLSTTLQERIDRVNRVMREKLTGLRVQRAFCTEAYEEQRFDDASAALTRTALRMNRIMSLLMPVLVLLVNGTQIAIVYSGAVQVGIGSIEVGDVMAVVQYVMQIMISITMFTMIFIMLPRALAAGKRISEVLAVRSEIQDGNLSGAEAARDVPAGQVEFRDVTFSYGGAQHPALEHISFTAAPGRITAIIGSTGCGKSTLLNLIPRFYDPDSGAVLIGGTDIRELSLKSLRNRIGYVPQKAVLFKGTIADNIRFGREGVSDDELLEAARIAQAREFIDARPEGIQAPVSQLGANLSGGQKQRLAIARALVRRADIYLFDDSFSALDAKTDAALRRELAKSTGNATVIIVAQKVSTILEADQILVLDDGRCVGAGTHRELMRDCAVYREIVESQLSEEEVQR